MGISYLFTTSAFLYIVAICGIAILIISKRDNVFFFLFGSTILPSVRHFLASVYTETFIESHIYTDESVQTLPSTFETQILGEGIYIASLQSIAHSEKIVSTGALMPNILILIFLGTIEILMERIPFFLLLYAITIIRSFFMKKNRKLSKPNIMLSGSVLSS